MSAPFGSAAFPPKRRAISGELPVGLTISGEGRIAHHDVTRFGLHRLCVSLEGRYPDQDVWLSLVKDREILAARYTEKVTVGVFVGYLWLYWKE